MVFFFLLLLLLLLLLFSFLFECVNRELLLHEAYFMYETKFFLFFYIHWPCVYYQSIIYTLQFSPKGGCDIQNYFNTHRTRQIITKKKKKTRLKILYACVECVLRNEPVRHRNRQSAPFDPEHEHFF